MLDAQYGQGTDRYLMSYYAQSTAKDHIRVKQNVCYHKYCSDSLFTVYDQRSLGKKEIESIGKVDSRQAEVLSAGTAFKAIISINIIYSDLLQT